MTGMRVRGKVVGNVVVLEEPMPEGTEVEVAMAVEWWPENRPASPTPLEDEMAH